MEHMDSLKVRNYFRTHKISNKEFDKLSKQADKRQSKMLSYMASL